MQTLQSRVSPSKVQVSQGPTGTSFLLHHPHVPKVRHDSRHHTCMSPRMFVGCLNGNRKRWVPAKKSSFWTEEEEEGFHRQLQHIMYMPKSGDQFRVQVQQREITGTYYHPSSGLTLNKHEVEWKKKRSINNKNNNTDHNFTGQRKTRPLRNNVDSNLTVSLIGECNQYFM